VRLLLSALLAAACLAGCSHAQMQLGGASAAGAGVSVQGGVSGASTFFWLGVAAMADDTQAGGSAPPPLAPARRVSEQDCRRPIEDASANLKCR